MDDLINSDGVTDISKIITQPVNTLCSILTVNLKGEVSLLLDRKNESFSNNFSPKYCSRTDS